MGQARPVPKTIEAHEFVLRDLQGRMIADLAPTTAGDSAELDFIDPSKGKPYGLVQSRFTGGGVLINDLDSAAVQPNWDWAGWVFKIRRKARLLLG
jgi:hypothetical protein